MGIDKQKQPGVVAKILTTERLKNISQEALPSKWVNISKEGFSINVKGRKYPTSLIINRVSNKLRATLKEKNDDGSPNEYSVDVKKILSSIRSKETNS
ncbi:MAG: hypothetical protein Q7S05_01910 [bacterium]|nr:hypothetical protein [bacterium]